MLDKNLIRKYLDGQCLDQEVELVEAYLADGNSDFTLLSEAIDMSWEDQPLSDAQYPLKAELLTKLHQQFRVGYESQNNLVVPISKATGRIWYRMAAAILLAVVLTALATYFANDSSVKNDQLADNKIMWASSENKSNTTQRITLPDGSKVWLAPRAGISYAISDQNEQRIVKLEGEAFFDVQHNEKKPFKIFAGNVCTQVLGTAFNVEAYAIEDIVKVSLVRGKVKVTKQLRDSGEQVIDTLHAHQLITYHAKEDKVTKDSLILTDMEAWINGSIVFNNITVSDALQRIAGRYGIVINVDKGIDLQHKRISAIFNQEEPLEQILTNMLFIADCEFRQSGNVYKVVRSQ